MIHEAPQHASAMIRLLDSSAFDGLAATRGACTMITHDPNMSESIVAASEYHGLERHRPGGSPRVHEHRPQVKEHAEREESGHRQSTAPGLSIDQHGHSRRAQPGTRQASKKQRARQ